jgi:hypothetical protein
MRQFSLHCNSGFNIPYATGQPIYKALRQDGTTRPKTRREGNAPTSNFGQQRLRDWV